MPRSLPIIVLTMGDPAGIGPEICLDAILDPGLRRVCRPVVFGDAAVLEAVAAASGKRLPSVRLGLDEWESRHATLKEPALLDFKIFKGGEVVPGRVDAATGSAAFRFIEKSIQEALAGRVAGVATAPIHKEALHAAGIPYPGHTEIFQTQTGADRACMMLTSDAITCSLVTTHIGLREVPAALSTERILDVIELTAEAMAVLRGRPPRLLVNALNPHAGEGGLFGAHEEERIIAPAIAAARERGVEVEGPVSPDTAFLPERRDRTDAYVCMYHDQGLIPLKTLAFEKAVNTTLGLPIVRTSVDHGTALDIAWRGQAKCASMILAANMAARLGAGGGKPSNDATRKFMR